MPVTRGETEEAGGLAVSWLNFSVWKQGSVWVARKRSGCARGNRRIGASRSIRTPISGAKRFMTPQRMSPSRSSGVNREIDATGTPARGVGKHPSFARAVKQLSKRRLEIPDTHGPWGLRRGGLDLSPVLVDVVVVLLGVLNLRHDALVLSRVRAACRAQVRVRRTRVASLHIAVGLRIHTRSERGSEITVHDGSKIPPNFELVAYGLSVRKILLAREARYEPSKIDALPCATNEATDLGGRHRTRPNAARHHLVTDGRSNFHRSSLVGAPRGQRRGRRGSDTRAG